MKRIISLSLTISLLFIGGVLNAQNAKNHALGHVLVYFKEGHLNPSGLNHNNRELDFESLFNNRNFRDLLKSNHRITGAKKVIRNARPDKRFSESRTGEQIAIPPFHNLICFEVPDTTNIFRLCAQLVKLKEILYAEPDFISNSAIILNNSILESVPPVTQPNDPYFSLGLFDPTNRADINALRAWDFTYGNSSIRVGIVDTGIDYTNPELGGTFGSNAIKVTAGHDYANGDSNPMDDSYISHGTGMAGIVGALTNNGQYVAGVAGGDYSAGNNGVQLIALKSHSSDGNGKTQDIVEAIYDAATSSSAGGYGCHVINCSFGVTNPGSYTDNGIFVNGINAERGVLSYAALNGVTLVAAKGNDGSNELFYPADFADNLVISVGAMDGSNQRANFSNYGNNIDVIAPGVVNSVTTTGRMGVSVFQSIQGTSAAAPFVAGAAALLKSININLHRDDVEKILKLSAADILDDNITNTHNLIGYDQYTGYGKLDAGRALEMISAPYVVQQNTITGGTVYNNNPSGQAITLIDDSGTGLSSGWYHGKIYEVRTTITIPPSLCNERYIWTRTSGASKGWSAAVPNNEMGWSEVVSVNGNIATLRTYVFYIEYDVTGQEIKQFYPTDPQHVKFAYTTLIKQPVTSTISGSVDPVCTAATFTINNPTPNSTLLWSSGNTGGLSINSSTGAANVQNNYNGPENVIATITSTITGCTSIQIPKLIHIGKPYWTGASANGIQVDFFGTMAVPYYISSNNPVVVQASVTSNPKSGHVSFSLTGNSHTVTTSTINDSTITFLSKYGNDQFNISFTASNACSAINGMAYGTIYFCNSNCTGGLQADKIKHGKSLNVFPNPASASITVQVNDSTSVGRTLDQPYQLALFNRYAQAVYSIKSWDNSTQIPLDGLPSDIYYLVVICDSIVFQEQVSVKK